MNLRSAFWEEGAEIEAFLHMSPEALCLIMSVVSSYVHPSGCLSRVNRISQECFSGNFFKFSTDFLYDSKIS